MNKKIILTNSSSMLAILLNILNLTLLPSLNADDINNSDLNNSKQNNIKFNYKVKYENGKEIIILPEIIVTPKGNYIDNCIRKK